MSQTEKLLNLLSDGQEHRTDEILEKCYGADHLGIARIGARVDDLKRNGCIIEGRRGPAHRTLYFYRLVKIAPEQKRSKLLTLEQKSEIAKRMTWVKQEPKKE